jgi:hypothetical protein
MGFETMRATSTDFAQLSAGRRRRILPNLIENFTQHFQMVQEAVADAMGQSCESEVPSVLSWLCEMYQQGLQLEKVPVGGSGGSEGADETYEYQIVQFNRTLLSLLKKLFSTHPSALNTETPRLLQLLLCMCSTSVSNLDSLEELVAMIAPLIIRNEESSNEESSDLSRAFESTCFPSLLVAVRQGPPADMLLFLLARILPGLSPPCRDEIVPELERWFDKCNWPAVCEGRDPRCLRVKGLTLVFQQCAACKIPKLETLVLPWLPKLGEAIEEYSSSFTCALLVRAVVQCALSSLENKQSSILGIVAASASLQGTRHWRASHLLLAQLLHCVQQITLDGDRLSVPTSLDDCISILAYSAPQLSWRLEAVYLSKCVLLLRAPNTTDTTELLLM